MVLIHFVDREAVVLDAPGGVHGDGDSHHCYRKKDGAELLVRHGSGVPEETEPRFAGLASLFRIGVRGDVGSESAAREPADELSDAALVLDRDPAIAGAEVLDAVERLRPVSGRRLVAQCVGAGLGCLHRVLHLVGTGGALMGEL